MSSSEMLSSRASLAAESAAAFLLMLTWPGTQVKPISFPSLVSSICSSKILAKIGWSCYRLYSRTSLKSNLFYFPTKAALWLNLQWTSQKRISRTAAKSNMFSPFPTRINRSQSFQVYFTDECSQISNLAAGQLNSLEHKPSRQVAVVGDRNCYYCFCQCL